MGVRKFTLSLYAFLISMEHKKPAITKATLEIKSRVVFLLDDTN